MPGVSALSSVNFLRNRRRVSPQTRKQDKIIFGVTLALFGLSCAVCGGIWWWNEQLRQRITTTTKQVQQVQQTVVKQSANEAEYLVYAERLRLLGEVYETRSDQSAALRFLQEILSPDIFFDHIRYDAEKSELSFDAKAANIVYVERFIQSLRQPKIATRMQNLEVSDIRRDDKGAYVLAVRFTLGPEAL